MSRRRSLFAVSWFTNLRLRAKLLVSFGLVVTLIAGLGAFAVSRLRATNDETTLIAKSWLPSVELVGAINNTAANLRIAHYRHVASTTDEAIANAEQTIAQRSAAEKEFDSALAPVLALGQSYPQLSSSTNFLNLQENLADTEGKLAFARQYYNDAAATLNRLLTTIPWIFVAPISGVAEREYYQAPR